MRASSPCSAHRFRSLPVGWGHPASSANFLIKPDKNGFEYDDMNGRGGATMLDMLGWRPQGPPPPPINLPAIHEESEHLRRLQCGASSLVGLLNSIVWRHSNVGGNP
jgi:hypothetical protein